MIKLCIVDDEEEIREGIANNVDWKAADIAVCGLAANGQEAMELCIREKPDVVLLDIHLPEKSGLEVAEWLHKTGHPAKIIVLSGYDVFAYAQQALRSGVVEYLLKPCKTTDILQSVLAVKRVMEEQQAKAAESSTLKIRFEKNLPVMRKQFLIDILRDGRRAKSAAEYDYGWLGIKIRFKNIYAVVVLTGMKLEAKPEHSVENQLMNLAVCNIIEEVLGNTCAYEIFEYHNDIVLLFSSAAGTDPLVEQKMQTVQKKVREYLWFTVSVGFGTVYPDANGILPSYQEAAHAAEFGYFFEKTAVSHFRQAVPGEGYPAFCSLENENQIVEAVIMRNRELLTTALHQLMEEAALEKTTFTSIQNSCSVILVRLLQLGRKKGIQLESLLGSGADLAALLTERKNIGLLKSRLETIALTVMEAPVPPPPDNQVVSGAVQYIQENYHRSLSLDIVARAVYVTPKYLSALFKQAMEKNFSDFVQQVRIQKACELLRHSRMHIYDIAAAVGYKSEKHFSRVFHSHLGMTPGQFRNLQSLE